MRTSTAIGLIVTTTIIVVVGCMRISGRTYTSQSGVTKLTIRNLRPTELQPGVLAGTWSWNFDSRGGGSAMIEVVSEPTPGSHRSSMFSIADGGLPARDHSGPVQFTIKRLAGTLAFDGSAEKGEGRGEVRFTPNEPYIAELSKLVGETIDADEALSLMAVELELEYVRKIRAAGYETTLADLRGLKFGGVTAEYAAAFKEGGYNFSCNDLRGLRFGGVSPEWATTLRKAGYEFSADDLRSLRFGGIDAAWAKELHDAGYRFDANALRSLRFAGLNAADAAAWRKAGYELSADELRTLRFRGISAEYAKQFADAGYKFTPEQLVSLKFRGVEADYAAALKKAGYDFSADDLTKLRFRGVSADYATALATPGKEHLTAEELIQLHFKGIDPTTIRKLRQ